MNSQVCVDANLVLKLVLPEPDSFRAQTLWDSWASAEVEPVAPPLLVFEGTSVIRKWVHQGLMSPERGDLAFQTFLDLDIDLLYSEGLHPRAWEMAKQFNRPQAHDSHYLALAEILGVELWTADDRLWEAVRDHLPWVKSLGGYHPPSATLKSPNGKQGII